MTRHLLWAPGALAHREGGVAGALADALDAAAVGVSASAADLRPHLDLPWDRASKPHADWPGDRWWTEHRRPFADALSAVGVDRRRADAVAGRTKPDADEETVRLKVFRYDPEIEGKREPRFDDFRVPFSRGMTVLDALIYARDRHDSSLTFRHSCRMAVCGSDALFINGRQRLGCQTQIADLDEPVRVEPLPHQEVVKDLVIDMEDFYEQMESVEPYFQPDELPRGELEEQRQSRENREKIKMSTRCIWCASCVSSCNIAAGDNKYLGPAAIVKGYRFYMNEREGDEIAERRLNILEQEHGVWRCQTQFSCTTVCPKDIPITEEIQEMKREAVKRNLKFW